MVNLKTSWYFAFSAASYKTPRTGLQNKDKKKGSVKNTKECAVTISWRYIKAYAVSSPIVPVAFQIAKSF